MAPESHPLILQQFYLKCLAHALYIVAGTAMGVAAVLDVPDSL